MKLEENTKLNIAVIQFDIAQFAPEENLRKAEQFIKQVESQARVIVFPEDFVSQVACRWANSIIVTNEDG